MSETFPEDWQGQDPAAPPAEAPREFTKDELEQARQQLVSQGADLGPSGGSTAPNDVAESGAALGMHALAAGAEAADVDTAAMLRAIKELSAKVSALEAEKRLASAPDVVKYAHGLHDHLLAKSYQHPGVQADADHTYGQAPRESGEGGKGVLGATGRLITAAEAAADTGDPGTIAAEAAKVGTWVTRHARRFPHIDYSYVLELAEDLGGAALKLAA